MKANRCRKSVLILESKRLLIFLSEQLSGENLALRKLQILCTFFIPQGRECKLLAPINLVNCIFLPITDYFTSYKGWVQGGWLGRQSHLVLLSLLYIRNRITKKATIKVKFEIHITDLCEPSSCCIWVGQCKSLFDFSFACCFQNIAKIKPKSLSSQVKIRIQYDLVTEFDWCEFV